MTIPQVPDSLATPQNIKSQSTAMHLAPRDVMLALIRETHAVIISKHDGAGCGLKRLDDVRYLARDAERVRSAPRRWRKPHTDVTTNRRWRKQYVHQRGKRLLHAEAVRMHEDVSTNARGTGSHQCRVPLIGLHQSQRRSNRAPPNGNVDRALPCFYPQHWLERELGHHEFITDDWKLNIERR